METLTQCRIKAGPSSATLDHHLSTLGDRLVLSGNSLLFAVFPAPAYECPAPLPVPLAELPGGSLPVTTNKHRH